MVQMAIRMACWATIAFIGPLGPRSTGTSQTGSCRGLRSIARGAQRGFQVRVPGPGLGRLDPAGLVAAGAGPGPGREVGGGREHAHVGAGLGDDHLRGPDPMPSGPGSGPAAAGSAPAARTGPGPDRARPAGPATPHPTHLLRIKNADHDVFGQAVRVGRTGSRSRVLGPSGTCAGIGLSCARRRAQVRSQPQLAREASGCSGTRHRFNVR